MPAVVQLLATAAAFVALTSVAGGTSANDLGEVKFHGQKFHYAHNHLQFTDGFEISSAQYDVTGDSADLTLASKTFIKVTVEGNPAAHTQITADFKDVANGADTQFLSDHAVIVPDPTRPDGKKATFTGHVHMIVSDAANLAEPSKSTMDQAIVLLGDGPDYPQVEADNVDGTAVPLK